MSPSSEPPRPRRGPPRACTPLPERNAASFLQVLLRMLAATLAGSKVDDGRPACEIVIMQEDQLVGVLNRLTGCSCWNPKRAFTLVDLDHQRILPLLRHHASCEGLDDANVHYPQLPDLCGRSSTLALLRVAFHCMSRMLCRMSGWRVCLAERAALRILDRHWPLR